MIYDMQKVLRAFGRLACGVTRKHIWGKCATPSNWPVGKSKRCRRCGLVVPVKTRNRKSLA